MTETILSVGLGTLPDLDGPHDDPAALLTGRLHLRAAQDLEALGVTQLMLDDVLDAGDGTDSAAIRLSALELAAWLAPATQRIGLVPTLTTTHTEPFLLGTMTATLDYASRGRAGVQLAPSLRASEAAVVGRRPLAEPAEAWRETGEVADLLRRLWDSWQDDAIIADTSTDRFIDRERLHYTDFEGTDSVGQPFTVKGPSIVPRPPQGHPVIVVRLEDGHGLRGPLPGTASDVAVAAAQTDAVIVPAAISDDELAVLRRGAPHARLLAALPREDLAGAIDALVERLAAAGSDGRGLVFAGVHLDARPHDAAELAERAISALSRAGLKPVASETGSLRQRWGVPAADNQYEGA